MIQREGKNMSFVAMIHNQNGIVAIADSKSTIEYSNGYKEEELGRNTKKIFHNNKFILLTYGKNEIDLSNNNYIPLEECIDEILAKDISHDIFVSKLSEYIMSHQRNDVKYCFNFLIGSNIMLDKHNRYISYFFTISNQGVHINPYNIKNSILAGGCHSQIVNSLIVNNNWTIQDMKSKLNALMEISLKLEECFNTYSAVGGPVITVSLDKKGVFREELQ